MEPIPETLDAIGEIDPFLDDGSLLDQLKRQTAAARAIAPDLVGVSVAVRAHGVTFTLVATDEDIATLDGVQYATSGPCVEALDEGQGLAVGPQDLLGEPSWQEFGQATAAAGIRSTLTFPIMVHSQVVGTVNLYGASRDAFAGRHPGLAEVFGAWAPGAVSNADLSFSTRKTAAEAPGLLRDQALVDTAVGVVAAARRVDVESARERLVHAARLAGVPLATLARAIVHL